MTETASLVIKTDSTDVTRTKGELDKLTEAGGRTEEAAKRVQRSWEQAVQRVASEMTALNGRVDVLNGTQSKMLAAVERVSTQMDRMTAAYERSTRAAERASRTYGDVGREATASATGVDRVNRSLTQTESSATAAGASIRRHLLAALGGLSAMRLIDEADNWGQMASRIRMATESTEEYERVQTRMVESANRTYRSINETREAFIQLSPTLRDMGLTLDESMNAIDAFSGLMVVNAASADRGADAMRALSVALQKGKLDADSWITIFSTLDSIVDVLADHSGMAAEEIRKLGASGQLSVDMLAQALAGQVDDVMRQVEEMPTTVRDAMSNVKNSFTEYLGSANEANGVTATMADAILLLGDNLTGVLNVALVAGAAGLTRYAAGAASAAAQTAAKAVQTRIAAAEELNLAKAQAAQAAASLAQARALGTVTANMAQQTAAANALAAAEQRVALAKAGVVTAGRSLLGILGGPVGIAVTAGLVATSFFTLRGAANEATTGIDLLTKSFRDLDEAQTEQALAQIQNPYKEAKDDVMQYAAQIEWLTLQLKQYPNSAMAKEWNTELVQARGNYSTAAQTLTTYLQKIDELQSKLAGFQNPVPVGPINSTNEAAAKYLERLADQSITVGLKTNVEQLNAMVEAGKLVFTPEDLEKAQAYAKKIDAANAALKASAESRKLATKELNAAQKAVKEFEEERAKSLQAQYDEIAKLDEQATALDRQALYFGYSEQALYALTIAELEHQRAALVGRTGAEEQIAILDRQIDAYKRMGKAMGDIATKEQQKADWEAWARDVDQIFQQVGQSLTDALFDGGKSGKQLIEDLFKTLTLRVLVQPVMGALQGAVTQTLGSALGIGGAQGGGVGGLLSGASNLSSLYGAVTGGIVESMASGAVAIGKTIGSSALTSFGLGMSSKSALSGMGIMGAEAMSGATAATGSAAAGGAAGAGQAFAAAAPYLAGAAAVAAIAQSAFGLGAREVTGQGMAGWVKGSRGGQDVLSYETATRKGGWARSDGKYLDFSAGDPGMQSAIGQLVTETSQSLKAYADALNLTTQDIQEYAKHIFIPTMDRSAEEIQQNILSEVNLYAQELTRDFWPALQEVRRGGEELTDTLARVATAVQGVNPVLEALGLKAYDVSLQGGVLASSLVDLFGGMEGFATATSSYYDAFYSEQEKFDLAAKNLAQSLSSVGVVMPDLTQTTDVAMSQFRALVEAQDLTTDAGQRAFAVLTQAAGGFAELTQAAESLGIAAVDAAAAVEDASAVLREREGLERQLAIAVGGVAKQREFELAALHESNRAIQEQIWALEDAATAAQNAASAEQARVSQVLSLQTQIDQAMGNTLAIRQRELAALDPISAMLQQHVYDLQDWQDKANRQYQDDLQRWQGLQQAVGTAFQEVQRIASAELAKLRDAARATDTALGDLGKRVSAQTGLLGRYISGLEGISSSLKSVFDFLEDQIRDLRQQSGAGGMYARQGWKLIGNALTTGVIPDADKLSQAVSAVRDDMAGKQYGSAFERDREALILANRLEALQGVTEPQMTLAEQQIAVSREQLAKLQAIFDEAEKTVNASRGIVDNTGDLGPAGEQVDKLSELWAESQTQVLALADIFGNTSYTKDLYESVLDAVTYESWAEKQIEGINAQLAIAQQQLDAFNGVSTKATTMIQAMNNMASALSAAQVAQPTQPTPTQPGQTVTPPPTNPLAGYILSPTTGLTEAQMKGKRLYRPRDFTEGDAYMKAHADVYAAYLQAVQQGWAERSSAGIRVFAQQHWDQYGSKEGVARAYADGGYYPGGMALVGEEGPELINFARPGQVYTASETQDILGRLMRPVANDGAMTESLIEEVKALRKEVSMLRYEARASAQNTSKISSLLDDVTQDGQALRTKAA